MGQMSRHSVAQRGWLVRVLQGQNRSVGCTEILFGGAGRESAPKLIWGSGRIQFLLTGFWGPHFLAGCQLWPLSAPRRHTHSFSCNQGLKQGTHNQRTSKPEKNTWTTPACSLNFVDLLHSLLIANLTFCPTPNPPFSQIQSLSAQSLRDQLDQGFLAGILNSRGVV